MTNRVVVVGTLSLLAQAALANRGHTPVYMTDGKKLLQIVQGTQKCSLKNFNFGG